MNLQYYELLPEKTQKNLIELINYIKPKFTPIEAEYFIKDIADKPLRDKKNKSNKFSGFIEIGEDYEKEADISKFSSDELKRFYQYFISREVNTPKAIKWRFYQYFKYVKNFIVDEIFIRNESLSELSVDIIIITDDNELIYVVCIDLLDQRSYTKITNLLLDTFKELKNSPNRVFIVANKTYRNIPLDNSIDIGVNQIYPELWLESNDSNSPFNGDDLLIVSELQLAGFNFTSMNDVLEYVYEESEGGQVVIYKKPGFFTNSSDDDELELIWQGIMIK